MIQKLNQEGQRMTSELPNEQARWRNYQHLVWTQQQIHLQIQQQQQQQLQSTKLLFIIKYFTLFPSLFHISCSLYYYKLYIVCSLYNIQVT